MNHKVSEKSRELMHSFYPLVFYPSVISENKKNVDISIYIKSIAELGGYGVCESAFMAKHQFYLSFKKDLIIYANSDEKIRIYHAKGKNNEKKQRKN